MARMPGSLQNIQTDGQGGLIDDYESEWAADKRGRDKPDKAGREWLDRRRWWDYDPVGRQANDIGEQQTPMGVFCVQCWWRMEPLAMDSYDIDPFSSGNTRHCHYCSVC